jgi:hypothetical protein
MTPRYARADSTITVSGTVTNRSGHPATGLAVELIPATSAFSRPSDMQAYPSQSAYLGSQVGSRFAFKGSIGNGDTASWTASFRASEAGFSGFGVYGLAAQAFFLSDSQIVASQGTYLPYWPSSNRPQRMRISWLWPLIDTPRETSCAATLTNGSLASSLMPNGRLGVLLATGLSLESAAKLTWITDPALLSEASTMTKPYWTGGQADCTQTSARSPSGSARQWLDELLNGTSGADMDFTPYANVDVSALSHWGLESDLASAYTLGQAAAKQIAHRAFGDVAWPADGVADANVLQTLAEQGHVSTVVLDSSQMPLSGSAYASDAITSFTTGVGTKLAVLLADHTISSDLNMASSQSPGTQFNAEQDVLAQTAMIAAEAPNLSRSIVVAPPRSWDPSATVASTLLSDTVTTPWLRPTSLATLAASQPAAGETHAQPGDHMVPSDELGGSYMSDIKRTDGSVGLLTSLTPGASVQYTSRTEASVAAVESSAWRGNQDAGRVLLNRLSAYASDSEDKLRLIVVPKATLAGSSGTLPVSVRNGLDEPIEVRVAARAPAAQLTISGGKLVTIPPGQVYTARLSLHSHRVASTQVQLQLVTRDGTPLPGTAVAVSVVSTLYGRAVLVLIVVALAIVLLTLATRWSRQWLADGKSGAHAAHAGSKGEQNGDGGGR